MNSFEVIERIDALRRYLVNTQLELLDLKNEFEISIIGKTGEKPAADLCYIDYLQTQPREIKITSKELYPPKIETIAQYRWEKPHEPSLYAKNRDLWLKAIIEAKGKNPLLHDFQPFEKALVWFTFFYDDPRVRDPDNFAIKHIFDSLVKCNILKQDDGKIVKYFAEVVYDKEKKIEVIIREGWSEIEKIRPILSSYSSL